MKRTLFVVALVFVSVTIFGQETNGQAINRARNFVNEWNSLVDMQENLSGESKIRLWNYMMGFAEGAYRLCEEFYNAGYSEFLYSINFFFAREQDCVKLVGNRTPYFRKYYYDRGFDRSCNGDARLGINDFR
jgi:hypothetical protein